MWWLYLKEDRLVRNEGKKETSLSPPAALASEEGTKPWPRKESFTRTIHGISTGKKLKLHFTRKRKCKTATAKQLCTLQTKEAKRLSGPIVLEAQMANNARVSRNITTAARATSKVTIELSMLTFDALWSLVKACETTE